MPPSRLDGGSVARAAQRRAAVDKQNHYSNYFCCFNIKSERHIIKKTKLKNLAKC